MHHVEKRNGDGGEMDQNLIHNIELASADFGSDKAPPHLSEVPHLLRRLDPDLRASS